MSVEHPTERGGSIRVFAEYDRDFHDEADVVVVGSGPCGAVSAYELARAGHRVILLEEGPPLTVADFELDAQGSGDLVGGHDQTLVIGDTPLGQIGLA